MNGDLIELLNLFNRKERFFLVGQALGNKDFCMSKDFRERLRNAVGLREEIPSDAFAAMDYHLDWVAAALARHAKEGNDCIFENTECGRKKLVMGNQEDVDLLVAFRAKDETHRLIFVEAKGYTSWNSNQLKSKDKRLTLLFGCDGNRIKGVEPYFCLMSPDEPDNGELPKLSRKPDGSPYWLKMKLPPCRLGVTRWDSSKAGPSRDGKHFRISLLRRNQ